MKKINELKEVFIVIPAFQAEDTIMKSIESALNQQKVNQRILVVDHGSTDTTYSLLEPLIHEKKISYIFLQRQQGELSSASRPLNTGLQHIFQSSDTDNSLFVRLDADDYFLNNDSLYHELKHSTKALLYIAPMIFATGNRLRLYDLKEKYKNYRSLLSGAVYSIPHHSCIYSTAIIKCLLETSGYFYDESIGYGEDLDFNIRLLKLVHSEDICFYNNPLTVKTINEKSITSNIAGKSFVANHLFLFRKHKNLNKLILVRALFHILFNGNSRLLRKLQICFGFPGFLYGKESNF